MPEHVADALNGLAGKEQGKHALLVCGGLSGASWPELRDKLQPDFIMAVNGAIQTVPANYWLCAEGDMPEPDWYKFGIASSALKVISHLKRNAYPDAIHVKRNTNEQDVRASLLGLYLAPRGNARRRLGTSAISALHLCGILGCSKVSSCGIDLCFKDGRGGEHHWYPKNDRYHGGRTTHGEPDTYNGLDTIEWWVQSLPPLFEYRDRLRAAGLIWHDYSNGLLQAAGFVND